MMRTTRIIINTIILWMAGLEPRVLIVHVDKANAYVDVPEPNLREVLCQV